MNRHLTCTGEQDGFRIGRPEGHFANYAERHWNRDVAEADIENVYLEFGYAVPESLRNQTTSPEAWLGRAGVFVHVRGALERGEDLDSVLKRFEEALAANQKNSTLLVNIHQWSALLAPPVRRRVAVWHLVVPVIIPFRTLGVHAFSQWHGRTGAEECGKHFVQELEMGLC